jgi:hypothetical protein
MVRRPSATAFDTARKAAGVDKSSSQFRDLRAKAATDKAESSGDMRHAQEQLGHSTMGMTEHYVRDRKGKKVTPRIGAAEQCAYLRNKVSGGYRLVPGTGIEPVRRFYPSDGF